MTFYHASPELRTNAKVITHLCPGNEMSGERNEFYEGTLCAFFYRP